MGKSTQNTKKDNSKHLIPLNKRTKSEQSEIATKGGKRSGEVRAARKTFRQCFITMLEQSVQNEDIKQKLKEVFPNISEDLLTHRMALVAAMYKKAMSGDVQAYKELRDTIGERPIQEIAVTDDTVQKIDVTIKK